MISWLRLSRYSERVETGMLPFIVRYLNYTYIVGSVGVGITSRQEIQIGSEVGRSPDGGGGM